MAKLFTSLRSYLERNKIFFETIMTLLISIMAILVSYCQLYVAQIQTNLQIQQTHILRQTVLPHFVIKASNNQALEEKMVVENQGAIISNFRCSSVVLLDVKLINWDLPAKNTSKTFYLNGYYFGYGYSPQGQGCLITIEGSKNDQVYSNLCKEFAMLVAPKNEFGEISLRRFLNITYTDQLGEEQSEYYYVPLIYGASPITEEEGKAIFSGYKNSFGTKKFIEFDKLSAGSLYELVAGK